jgi:hypothetical protein
MVVVSFFIIMKSVEFRPKTIAIAPNGRVIEFGTNHEYADPQAAAQDFNRRAGIFEGGTALAFGLGLIDGAFAAVSAFDVSQKWPALVAGILGAVASFGVYNRFENSRAHLQNYVTALKSPKMLPRVSAPRAPRSSNRG